jgi:hypothetical protein
MLPTSGLLYIELASPLLLFHYRRHRYSAFRQLVVRKDLPLPCAAADIALLNILIQNLVETVVFDNTANHFVFCALYYASVFGYSEIVDRIFGAKPKFNFDPPKFRISSALAAAAAGC